MKELLFLAKVNPELSFGDQVMELSPVGVGCCDPVAKDWEYKWLKNNNIL